MNFLGIPLSPTRDYEDEPRLKSRLVRWVLRFYSQRLTRGGRWLIWPTMLFVGYGGLSLQIQGYVPFSYLFALWLVALGGILVWRPRVRVGVLHALRVCAGEVLPVEVDLEQVGRIAGRELVVLPHRLPRGVEASPAEGVLVRKLGRGERRRVRLGLLCPKRGVYTLRGFRVESAFPIRLMNAWRIVEEDRELMVYPAFTQLARLALPTGRRHHPGGVALASSLGESFEFIGNRDYREGDSPRDIDWRATARMSRPIVREYRDEYFMRVAVILDTHIPAGGKAALKEAREAFERAVSVAAAISDHMARQDYLVDLFAAGPNLYHLTAGRSLAYLDQILDILACVRENPEEPFAVIEPEIFENLSKITTVICIFLDWNEARRAFAHRLAQEGAGVKVVVVRDAKPSLDPMHEADVVGNIPVIGRSDFANGIEEL